MSSQAKPWYSSDEARDLVANYTSGKWGRSLNQDHYNQLGAAVGGSDPSGQWSLDQLTRGYGFVDEYAKTQGWQPSGPATLGNPEAPQPTPVPPEEPQRRGSGTPEVPGYQYQPPPAPTPPPVVNPPTQGPSGPMGGVFDTSPANPVQQAAQEALLKLLTGAQSGVALSDPSIQPVSDAYRSSRQRGYERERNAIAERAAATGTAGSGGFSADALGALQGANRDVATFDAQLVQDEMRQRREQLQQALQLATQTGDAQAQRDLQRQLAMVDATLREGDLTLRRQLGLSDIDLRRQLGMGDLDIRRSLGLGDLDLRNRGLDLQRELGGRDLDLRGRTLSQQGALGRGDLALRLLQSLMQNDQYYSGLGLNASQLQALLNQNALTQLLGGF